jgi:signal transduction histidine kinase
VRARLLLAFFGITAFAVLAAAAGIYAFREVGSRLDIVDTRIPPTLSALELSRSAERIIAAAPALLAATDRDRRDEINAALATEIARLNAGLAELKGADVGLLPGPEIELIVSALTANLATLEDVVARRIATNEHIGTLRRRVFQTNDETQRLLAPWLEVTGGEITALATPAEARAASPAGPDDRPPRLASLIALQRLMRTAQAQVSAVADLLAEASTTDQPQRLPILTFQLSRGLRDLEATAAGLDLKLRPLFLEQVAELRAFAEGPDTITEARERELALVGEGEGLLTDTARLSAQLTAAVDRLGSAAKQDIGTAISDALSVQRLSTRALVVVVGVSLLTSVLIVWLYVGGNIVRRLTGLSDRMLAIAGGGLMTPVAVEGTDEIAAMGRAVEVFRQNTLERDALLTEKSQTADRLDREVKERTAELEFSNTFKSRFLAAASHDLRQPLYALNLFIAQLGDETDPVERARLVERIDASVASMNELFEGLLDMAKLDAGILEPTLTEFPVEHVLKRLETTFAGAAREKGLRLRIVPSKAWVRSDFILLERILLNHVSNAVRCTELGGVVIGCRPRGAWLRFDVWDSGPGIPRDQQKTIFNEFYRLSPRRQPDRLAGLGLGLTIVERLARLLGYSVDLDSRVGKGSRFSISVPIAATGDSQADRTDSPAAIADPLPGKLIVVIDDDELVLEGMRGILRKWGCTVLTAPSVEAALERLAAHPARPDLIISDYRLADGQTGVEAIARAHQALGFAVPAFLITGDTAPARLRDATAGGYRLLHKPIAPMALRAMLNRLLSAPDSGAETKKSGTRS